MIIKIRKNYHAPYVFNTPVLIDFVAFGDEDPIPSSTPLYMEGYSATCSCGWSVAPSTSLELIESIANNHKFIYNTVINDN